MKLVLALLSFVLFTTSIMGQSKPVFAALLPQINISKSYKNQLGFNVKLESLQSFYNNYSGINEFNYQGERIDLQNFLTYKLTPNMQLALGYQLRFTQAKTFAHRLLQQNTIVKNTTYLRLSHRFRTDQTFSNTPVIYRFRYRLATEMPLNGTQINPNEFYFLGNVEFIGLLQNKIISYEQRLCTYLGYLTLNNNKFEIGLDYRLDKFNKPLTRQRYWIRVAWLYKLK